jgi:hypothetical protein
MSMVKQIAC